MSSQIQPKYLNVREAAKYCGLSERTLKRRIKERRFKTFSRGRVLIDRESLDAWIGGPKEEEPTGRSVADQIAWHAAEIRRLVATLGEI